MKFACDRCKTRYSIADERVRGKILKIRCKACANVITVKEGMEVPAEHERASRSTTMAPQTTVGSGGSAPVPPALAAAFSSAMASPPAKLEDEWYVSRDGEQQGPFGLASAQSWVSIQPYDADLYCWCEGFDDWLPVDRIAHFRGLRPRPVPPAVPSPSAAPSAATADSRRAVSGPVPALAGPGGPSSVSPSVPSSSAAPAPTSRASAAAAPSATASLMARSEATASAPAPSAPLAPYSSMPGALAPAGPAMAAAPAKAEDKPLFAATMATLDGARAGAASPSANGTPALGGLALDAPAPLERNGASASAARRDAFDAGDLGAQGFGADASASGLRAPVSSALDDELEFGEVSRVVRIADIGKSVVQRTQPIRTGLTGPNATLPAGWGAPAASPSGPAGAGAALPQVASVLDLAAGRSEAPVVAVARQHRNHALLLGLVAVGLIGAGVVALVLVQSDDSGDPGLLSLSGRDVRDLTIRPDDPRRGSGARAGSNAGTSTARTGNGTKRIVPQPASGGTTPQAGTTSGGKIETAPTSGALTALGGDEVEEMSQRNSSGLQRCYEQALKKDIFLEVKSIKVTISIDPSGVVKDVTMSSHADHVLGQCMISRIRNWRFRPNLRGLDAKFTVAFGRT